MSVICIKPLSSTIFFGEPPVLNVSSNICLPTVELMFPDSNNSAISLIASGVSFVSS